MGSSYEEAHMRTYTHHTENTAFKVAGSGRPAACLPAYEGLSQTPASPRLASPPSPPQLIAHSWRPVCSLCRLGMGYRDISTPCSCRAKVRGRMYSSSCGRGGERGEGGGGGGGVRVRGE